MEAGDLIVTWINRLIVPTTIYDGVEIIARGIFTYVTPVLLVIGIATRTLEEQLDLTNSTGRWVNAVRDMAIIGAAITVYFAAGNMVNEFFSSAYSYFEQVGSVGSITSQLADTIELLEKQKEEPGVISMIAGGAWYWASIVIYYLSLIAVTTIIAFLHLAQALGYGLCFCWGLIALPMSITRNLRLLKGWAMFSAFILVWPIIESLCMGMIASIFSNVAETLTDTASGNTDYAQGAIIMAYTTLNIILVIIAIVAPFVTNALVANVPAGKDFVVPFIAGAMANVAAMNAINVQAAKPATQASKALVSGTGSGIRGVANRISESFRPAPSTVTASNGAGSTNSTTSQKPARDPGARQARRGAIINQNQSKSKS
jgi:hypothetical protein